MSQVTIPSRAEIPVEHTWDTASIFPTPEAWDATFEAVVAQLPALQAFQGHIGDSPTRLADWLEMAQSLTLNVQRIGMYAFLEYSVDTSNQTAVARTGRAGTLSSQVQAATAFAEPEMMAIGFDKLFQWVASEPRLAIYQHYFERLQHNQAHVRSSEVEELLGQVNDAFQTASTIHGVLANTDLSIEPATTADNQSLEIVHGNMAALLSDVDRTVRRTAWENYADAHLAFKNTMAACISAGVKQDVFRARARRYRSSLEASLAPNKIPVEVFHNLVDTYRKHLPTWHRYWRVRRQALGLDKLYEYDIKAPLTQAKIDVPYQQAVDWIATGMQPLGEEYTSILRRGTLEERWVDIYPNKGKRAGAFSYGGPGTHPFVFMSYNDDLFSLSTLAHELGHSLHSYYSWQTQPQVYARYTLFAAEVASNFNQAMVRSHLLATQGSRDFQIGLIEEAMSNFHRYFFIMPTLARFELEIHERVERGQALNADALIQLMADLFAEGYGGEVELDVQRTGITWGEFSTHLYSNFYVFQYATGIAGAHALAEKILTGEAGAVDRYLSFLKAGGSLYPLDALKQAGVDLTTPEPVERTFAVLASLVERLEKLVGDGQN
ncbi:MAG: oligoendopeptidase F [Chloroflexi bacterium]|nr:oligoendopeptidase F [Chloroflexota bacterium]